MQIGSFVPAESVRMHVFDSVSTRMGASDNLAMGRSTFLEVLRQTPNNLARLFAVGDDHARNLTASLTFPVRLRGWLHALSLQSGVRMVQGIAGHPATGL